MGWALVPAQSPTKGMGLQHPSTSGGESAVIHSSLEVIPVWMEHGVFPKTRTKVCVLAVGIQGKSAVREAGIQSKCMWRTPDFQTKRALHRDRFVLRTNPLGLQSFSSWLFSLDSRS